MIPKFEFESRIRGASIYSAGTERNSIIQNSINTSTKHEKKAMSPFATRLLCQKPVDPAIKVCLFRLEKGNLSKF